MPDDPSPKTPDDDEKPGDDATRASDGGPPEPIELEPPEERDELREPPPPPPPAKRDDESEYCPNCGALMEPGQDVCIRCGFDPNAPRDDEPATPTTKFARTAREPREPAETSTRPLSVPGRGDLWLPAFLGGVSLLALAIGYLAGWPGLFPHIRLDETVTVVPWADRFAELLRTLVLMAFWTGCSLAGLFALSFMLERQFGDARLAAARMAATIATIRLITFIIVPGPRWVEWMSETVLQAAAFILLTALLFGIVVRNAAILAAWTLMAIIVLWLFSFAVQWAMTG